MGWRYKYEDADLVKAVEQSTSMAGTLRALGMHVKAGGNYKTVGASIQRLGLDTSHWTGTAWNRGLIGSHNVRPIEDYLEGRARCHGGRLRKRLIKEGIKEERCERCGITEWQGEPAPLQLDHINGDREDYSLSNLQILCANCHCLTPTHSNRNNKARLVER